MPTWRTLSIKKKFALIHFEIDDTFAVVETKKLRSDAELKVGSEAEIKCGAATYKAKILDLNDLKDVLEQTLATNAATIETSPQISPQPTPQPSPQPSPDQLSTHSTPQPSPQPRRKRKRQSKSKKSPAKSKKKATLLCSGDGPDEPAETSTPLPTAPPAPLLTAPPEPVSPLPEPAPVPAPPEPLSPLPDVPTTPYLNFLAANSTLPLLSPFTSQPTPHRHRSPSIVRRVHRQLFETTTTTTDNNETTVRILTDILKRLDRIETLLATDRCTATPIPSTVPPPSLTATHSQLSLTDTTTTDMLELDNLELYERLRSKSSSSGHFATLLVKEFFTEEERVNRNCLGKRGKEGLDPVRLDKIGKIIFTFYANESRGNRELFWKNCVIRIDEFLRRKRCNKE